MRDLGKTGNLCGNWPTAWDLLVIVFWQGLRRIYHPKQSRCLAYCPPEPLQLGDL